jgi:hypothetical protein
MLGRAPLKCALHSQTDHLEWHGLTGSIQEEDWGAEPLAREETPREGGNDPAGIELNDASDDEAEEPLQKVEKPFLAKRVPGSIIVAASILAVMVVMWAVNIGMALSSIDGVALKYLNATISFEQTLIADVMNQPIQAASALQTGLQFGAIPGSAGQVYNKTETLQVLRYLLEIVTNSGVSFLGYHPGINVSSLLAIYREDYGNTNPDSPLMAWVPVPCTSTKPGLVGVKGLRGAALYRVNQTLAPLLDPKTYESTICPYSPSGHESGSTPRPWFTRTLEKGTDGWGTGIYASVPMKPTDPKVLAISFMELVRDPTDKIVGAHYPASCIL